MAVNESLDNLFDLTDSRRPPVELKVASGLSAKNPRGTIYELNKLNYSLTGIQNKTSKSLIAHYCSYSVTVVILVGKACM